ncbi:hypothetical protein NM688_g6279 [Phlebia brevispora]|uniref:Uncharacterized protein n=1 Tax=Phlebia brevispora TaxID=194682 RepID=A0ACC1SI07_9APHY|nr:hypothetical protein NM688_g6279 [Phlebia brevispora]
MTTEKTKDEQSPSSGTDAWATIDRTVRNVDEGKVKDCTDDIDTLLVFAGLYSAILTALLIESYKALQEDPQDVMVQLLRNISMQGSIRNGQFLNSTSLAPSSEPFEAPTWAVRVNVCWFSSLVLSLSTASYGILVKQWLREYLSIDRTPHQERIRIRHFRSQGVEDWHLYDIAAVLPFILQVSLALFFVGLCFFTAAVHSSIRSTSVVLVSAWAVLILFAVLAPLFSPRCPFKTPLLKAAFSRLRPHLRRIPFHIVQLRRPFFRRSTQQDSADSISLTSTSLIESSGVRDAADLVFLRSLSTYAFSKSRTTGEEVDIRNSDANDLVIFRTVDAIFLDDNLLAMMREALGRRPPPAYEVFRFVVSVLQGRLGIPLEELNQQSAIVSWPWALSYTARTSLIDMVAYSLLHDASFKECLLRQHPDPFTKNWFRDAVLLIFKLSSPQQAIPKGAKLLFNLIFQTVADSANISFLHGAILHQLTSYDPPHSLECLTRTLTCTTEALESLDIMMAMTCLQYMTGIFFKSICSHDPPPEVSKTLISLLSHLGSSESGDSDIVQAVILLTDVTATLLHGLTSDSTIGPQTSSFDSLTTAALEFVLSSIPTADAHPYVKRPYITNEIGLDELLPSLLTAPQLVYPCLEFFSTHPEFLATEVAHTFIMKPINKLFPSRDTVISILSAREAWFKNKLHAQSPLDLVSLLHLCRLAYELPCSTADRGLNTYWHSMFTSVARCIMKSLSAIPVELRTCQQSQVGLRTTSHADACRAAHSTLLRIEEDGDHGAGHYVGPISHSDDAAQEDEWYHRWLGRFDITLSQVPDELIDALRCVICPMQSAAYECEFWRIRRLGEMDSRRVSYVPPSVGDLAGVSRRAEYGPHADSENRPPVTHEISPALSELHATIMDRAIGGVAEDAEAEAQSDRPIGHATPRSECSYCRSGEWLSCSLRVKRRAAGPGPRLDESQGQPATQSSTFSSAHNAPRPYVPPAFDVAVSQHLVKNGSESGSERFIFGSLKNSAAQSTSEDGAADTGGSGATNMDQERVHPVASAPTFEGDLQWFLRSYGEGSSNGQGALP